MVTTFFTPLASLIGGGVIGLAAVLLMAFTGRIAGVSGIVARLFPPYFDREFLGRLGFMVGLATAPIVWLVATGYASPFALESRIIPLIVGGLLVGFGSVWGNGCTSGHGVCGISRLSMRSIVATIIFMVSAIVTVNFTRHLI